MSNVIKTQFLRKISLRSVKRSWTRISMLIKRLLSCFSCSKELGQWDLLMEFGKTKGHANPFLGKYIWLHLLIFIVWLKIVISCISFDHCGLWTNLCRLPFCGSFYFLNCTDHTWCKAAIFLLFKFLRAHGEYLSGNQWKTLLLRWGLNSFLLRLNSRFIVLSCRHSPFATT